MSKKSDKALGDIRLLGPDIEPFRKDVKFIYDYIDELEKVVAHLRRADHVYRELDNNSRYLSDRRLDELHAKALAILRQSLEGARTLHGY